MDEGSCLSLCMHLSHWILHPPRTQEGCVVAGRPVTRAKGSGIPSSLSKTRKTPKLSSYCRVCSSESCTLFFFVIIKAHARPRS